MLKTCCLKNNKMIYVCFQSKPFNITVIQVYAPTTNAAGAEPEWCYEELQDLLELTHQKKKKKRCSFHHRGLECKSRNSRDTWSNRQVWPWCTKWSRAKADRVLPRWCTGHRKHPLPTQEMTLHMDITRCQYKNQIDYILYSQRWRSSKQTLQPKMEKL